MVAGTGEQCLPFDERCGDGGKATEATLMSPKGDDAIFRSIIKKRNKCSSHVLSVSREQAQEKRLCLGKKVKKNL